ncbi:uncharacterized protein LOC129587845 [Paramacrobiotus metropolitanus]|uniref:uncharacterized protein LOC129587845 n=1 Tax=Paramacrobiotus metropolitanus TaxID=2943436 RepID=UPI002445B284|nr:uncharacterized protein LOC129587845 [Paramacrobiotus metropolitanus]
MDAKSVVTVHKFIFIIYNYYNSCLCYISFRVFSKFFTMNSLVSNDYLQQISTVLPLHIVEQPAMIATQVPQPATRRKAANLDGQPEAKQHVKSFALVHCFVNTDLPSLSLRRCDELIASVDHVSDHLLHEMYECCPDLLARKEYPHLYTILDSTSSSSFARCIAYIRKQQALYIALDGRYANAQPGTDDEKLDRSYKPAVLLIATENFIFIFDWTKMDTAFVRSILQPLFADLHVHIVVHDFATKERILYKKYGIKAYNLYDIAEAEKRLEKKQHLSALNTYSIADFQQRYHSKSRIFEKSSHETFQHTPLEKLPKTPSRGVNHYSPEILEDCMKQVVYLPIIKSLQTELFMRRCRQAMEDALLDVWISSEEWAYCTASSNTNAPIFPNENDETELTVD